MVEHKKKRLVITVGGYYPTYSPPGICLEKIVAYLKKSYDITVIAWRRSNEIPEDSFSLDGVQVVQVSDWLNRRQINAINSPAHEKLWRFIRIGYSLLRGEGTLYWVRRTMLKELERQYAIEKFDSMVSIGFPITTHLACKDFASKHPGIRWLTYSTDTYYKSRAGSRFRMLAQLRSRAEHSAYSAATHNFFSREIMNSCQEFLGTDVLGKSSILDYMLFEASESSGFDTTFLNPNRMNLLYAGGFIEKVRDPRYFLSILEKLPSDSKITWHIFSSGQMVDVIQDYASRMPERIVYHKPVKVNEIRDIMNACDVLLNISNDMDQFFPSKVFDYLSTGKPILDFTYPGRAKNVLFEKHPCYLDVEMFGDSEKDTIKIQEFCAKSKDFKISASEIAEIYPEYTPEQNLKEFVRQLEL